MITAGDTISYSSCTKGDNWIPVIEAKGTINPAWWVKDHRQELDNALLDRGGILLRNFEISSLSEFNAFSQVICPDLLEYTYRSTPRTKLGGKLYTATEYPAAFTIPLHNENSYSRTWPQKIMFYCAIAARTGGQTPLADSRKVYAAIDLEIREKFETFGVLYVRNYTPGIDLSWQEVFQTSERPEVDKYCQDHGIECIWNKDGPELTTKQVCQAIVQHPVTNEKVWFNQAHLFHNSTIEAETGMSWMRELGENVPRNAYYGNGEPITLDVLSAIKDAYQQNEILFEWKVGDLLILDNILVAHGRRPFEGERKIVVSMG